MSRERVFRASKTKALLLIVGAGLFVWGGIFMTAIRPFTGWLVVLFFGACVVTGAVLLATGGASLSVDEEGFELAGVVKRTRFLWKDIESIQMAKIRRASVIAINYKSGDPRRSQLSRSLAGMDAIIGNIYNVPLKELCAILNEWHEHYRRVT